MTIEDRLRRVLADAVADEPPLRGAPLEAITHRHRRSRSLLAGAVAMALILGAVVAFAAVRGPVRGPVAPTPTPSTVVPPPSPSTARPARPPSTVPTTGWKTFTHVASNLRFRYPPGWAIHPLSEGDAVDLVPPQGAGRPVDKARFRVSVQVSPSFWVGRTGRV